MPGTIRRTWTVSSRALLRPEQQRQRHPGQLGRTGGRTSSSRRRSSCRPRPGSSPGAITSCAAGRVPVGFTSWIRARICSKAAPGSSCVRRRKARTHWSFIPPYRVDVGRLSVVVLDSANACDQGDLHQGHFDHQFKEIAKLVGEAPGLQRDLAADPPTLVGGEEGRREYAQERP